MAEIKSSLELAMERTKRMAISQEEREEIKRRGIVQKANSLFHRSMEGHLPLNEILREIERMDEKTRPMVKEILFSQWIDSLSLNGENEKLLGMIESLKGREIDENGLFFMDHISVTVVLIRILPQIGIKTLLDFHRFDLL
jgi:hypothetical protein